MTAAKITAEDSDLRNINYSRPTFIILSFDRYILAPVLADITLTLLLKSVCGPGNGRVVSLQSSAVGSGGGVGLSSVVVVVAYAILCLYLTEITILVFSTTENIIILLLTVTSDHSIK